MKKVLILVNHDVVIYNFRKELVERLLKEEYKVYISSPYGERIDDLIAMGCKYNEINIERHGTNVIKELSLILYYSKTIKDIKPDIVLSFTIKPNIYGGLACMLLSTPFIANITGLGNAVENGGIMKRISILLYKVALKKAGCIFFQNKENKNFFEKNNITVDKHKLIPGSGVNLERFNVLDYPSSEKTEFVFISRIMRDKGIEEYLKAAKYVSQKYPDTKFHICGFCEDEYKVRLRKIQDENIVTYHGMLRDIKEILQKTHCTIHPSYHEGLSNVLLESAACARPIITTDIPGCREVVDNGINGYLVRKQDSKDLINKIEAFIKLDYKDKIKMGLAGRKKVEREFDRNIVVEAYINEINSLTKKRKS